MRIVLLIFIFLSSYPCLLQGQQKVMIDTLVLSRSEMEVEEYITDSLDLLPKNSFKDMKEVFLRRVLTGKTLTHRSIRGFTDFYTLEIGSQDVVSFLDELRAELLNQDKVNETMLYAVVAEKLRISKVHPTETTEKLDSTVMDFYAIRDYYFEHLVYFLEMNYGMGIYFIKHKKYRKAERVLFDVFLTNPILISIGDNSGRQGWDKNMVQLFEVQKKAFLELSKLLAEHRNEIESVNVKFGLLKGIRFRRYYMLPEVLPVFNKYLKMAGQELIPIPNPDQQIIIDSN